MPNLSDKLSLPVNWTKVLVGSGLLAVALFVIGLLFKIRFLLAIADIIVFGALAITLIVFVSSIIRNYTTKPN